MRANEWLVGCGKCTSTRSGIERFINVPSFFVDSKSGNRKQTFYNVEIEMYDVIRPQGAATSPSPHSNLDPPGVKEYLFSRSATTYKWSLAHRQSQLP